VYYFLIYFRLIVLYIFERYSAFVQVNLRSVRGCRMHYNGPAIKCVNAAERTEAVCRKASSGQNPGTAVVERSTAHFLPVMAEAFWTIRVSRYKVDRKQVISHGIVVLLVLLVRSALSPFEIYQESRDAFRKKCDEFMNFIVRVSTSGVNCGSSRICHWSRMPFFLSSGQKLWF
jgi:hypothetical protein